MLHRQKWQFDLSQSLAILQSNKLRMYMHNLHSTILAKFLPQLKINRTIPCQIITHCLCFVRITLKLLVDKLNS